MNSNDKTFIELRDKNIVGWGPHLSLAAKKIEDFYRYFRENQSTMTVKELKGYTEKLPVTQFEHKCISMRQQNFSSLFFSLICSLKTNNRHQPRRIDCKVHTRDLVQRNCCCRAKFGEFFLEFVSDQKLMYKNE